MKRSVETIEESTRPTRLRPVAAGDHRALAGIQPFVKDAPLTFLMVADTSRMKGAEKDPEQRQWIWADAGFISQNIYLFCASKGLATGVHALVNFSRELLMS